MRKKLLIIAAIVVAVLLAVLAAILIFFPRHRSVESGDTGSLYDYRFTTQRNGLLVTVSGGEEGCAWAAGTEETGVVTVREEPAESGETAFLISPAGGGDARVTLSLRGTERAYQIYVDVHAEGKEVRTVGCGHQEFPAALTDEDGRYRIVLMERGKYLVYMVPALDADWAIECENGSVRCEPYDLWDGALPALPRQEGEESAHTLTLGEYFTISCLKNEPDVVYVYDRTGGDALKIELDYDETLGLHPVSHTMVKYGSAKAANE